MADSSSHHLSNLLIGSDTPATLPRAKPALTPLHGGSGCLLPSHCNSFCKYLRATLFLLLLIASLMILNYYLNILCYLLTFYIVHYPKYLASFWSKSDCVLSCFLFYPFPLSFSPFPPPGLHLWAFTCPTLGNPPRTFVVLRFLNHDTVSLKKFTIYLRQDNIHIPKALLPL